MSSHQRTIAVVTGSRAEFGLLQPVMQAISEHPKLQLRVVISGTHMAAGTWRDVTAAGFVTDAKVRMQRKGETGRAGDVEALSRGVSGFGRWFAAMVPDLVLVLGDRIEPMAAALAGQIGGFAVGHIHGGDRAEGVADEAMRHAISKLATVHFPATAQSARRLKRMGEDPGCIFNVGSPAIDGLKAIKPAADAPDIIVMQHPVGFDDPTEQRNMAATLKATARADRLVMAPNADPGGAGIRAALDEAGIEPVEHLRRERWLGLLAGARLIVGNSSAGLIEAAALKTACVNIGPRQAGRQKPPSVVDCDYGVRRVRQAISKARQLDLSRLRHPYGNGQAGRKIAEVLAQLDWSALPRRKRNTY
jgi:UDP-hydrolysing UDP-N-acetyl-D-glucosamine 2-epimerase